MTDYAERRAALRGRPRPMSDLRDWLRGVGHFPSTVATQGRLWCWLCPRTEDAAPNVRVLLYPESWFFVRADQGCLTRPEPGGVGDVPVCPECSERLLAERHA